MSARTSVVRVRVDDEVNARATKVLATTGLSVSDAVRLLLHRVVADQNFPLALTVPNAKTRVAMAQADVIVRLRRKRFVNAEDAFADLEKIVTSKQPPRMP